MAAYRILVLEDNLAVGSTFGTFLRRADFDVELCTTMEAAKTRVRAAPPDALLTDVRVGEFNGLQVAILFRTMAPHAPIVVVSGHDDPVIRHEARTINAEFLLKPVDLRELRKYFESARTRPN